MRPFIRSMSPWLSWPASPISPLYLPCISPRWAPHAGTIPGSATRLPLLECPADHVIDLERMKPEEMLREHSLLCNPRTPAHVLAGARSFRVRVRVQP